MWMRALTSIKVLEEPRVTTLLSVIREVARDRGDAPALVGEDERLTYRELVELADRYTGWAVANDLGRGQTVCLLMPNCLSYVAIWCGLAQAGCTVALLNTLLVGHSLAHAIRATGASRMVVAASLLQRVMAIMPDLPAGPTISVHGARRGTNRRRIEDELPPPMACVPGPMRSDRALLIATSGTTGLPKAANVTHARILEWSLWFAGLMDTRPDDRLYNCLPMYHSVGGVVAVGAILSRGGSVVIRERFSANRFWEDVVENRCTIVQYIGELCRYLVAAPASQAEARHVLRLCCGNGLRRDVWEAFQDRFGVPEILEFYAATEGNVSLYNCEGKPGAIGRIPAFLKDRFATELVRLDPETCMPVRDEQGRCVRCATDEPGEAIGRIDGDAAAPARHFDGYTDQAASARKTLRDVFTKGDLWFRTGDLMRRDKAGFFSFVDRVGDTFRWKGENVSASEVAEAVGSCAGVVETVVYGVVVPGHEGRAGMAAITRGKDFDLARLQQMLEERLPPYARPVFLRFCPHIDRTGTFKLSKRSLEQDGLSATAAGEVWFRHRELGTYVELCDAHLDRIRDGTIRL